MKKATFIVSLIEGILNIGAAIFAVIYGFVFIVVYGIGHDRSNRHNPGL